MKFFLPVIFFVAVSLSALGQAPTINAFPVGSATVAPFSGATGTTMTITGTNFTGATVVSFGGTNATSFTVVNSTTITAVVGSGTSGIVSVTTPGGTANRGGFTYLPLSRIITDFAGYWSSTTASANTTKPNDTHNLLGFSYNGTFFSTGANDAVLTSNSITFTSGNYRAVPVTGITGTNSGSSVFFAMASKVDGSTTTALTSGVATSTIRSVLTDGIHGLNLGTGVTNLPASATLTFTINSIDATKISDAEPDILITQIADPSTGNDIFQFIDASGNNVGNTITQDMTVLTSFGQYRLDLFTLAAGAPYNTAVPYGVSFADTTRSLRLVAFKLSDFGITAGNYASIKALKIIPSGNSDYAFIAYNANAINIPPNISQNSASTTSLLCTSGGTAVLSVIGTAASGGTLSYSWEQSTDNGTTWTSVTNGGNFSGATTQTLSIANSPASGNKYRATVAETGSATPTTSSPFTISYAPLSIGGSISGGTTVCTGTNSTILTLSGITGSVVRWESSTNGFSTNTPIANTTTTLTATNLVASTQYRAVVQSSPCASSNSALSTITVSAASVGGSISGSTTVCAGTNSTALILSGYTGSIVKWQFSTDNFTSVITDVVNTTTSLTATNITVTTKYRAVVQNGSCAVANSAAGTVSVSPATDGGSISGSASVCTGTNSTLLTLHGYVGNVLKWQFSTDNFSTSTDVANTTASLTATDLTATTQYRAVVQSGVCGSANSAVATLTVKLITLGGSVNGSASACLGTNTTTLTLSGYRGSILRWQSSTDNFSTSTDIANTTATLTATNLTLTTQYRANVKNNPCDSATSSVATITVNPVSVGGSVSGGATVCTGTNSTTLTLSGHTGSIVKWQSSTDNFSSVINDVVNTTPSLTASNLTVTTQYRAVIQSGVCASANSSIATVTVNAASVGGSISGSTTVCTGTNSTTVTLSGNTGSIIKWQFSTDNFTSVINDVVNTTTSLTASDLTVTTQYRAVIQSGVCATANSSVATVTVNAASVGGSISGSTTVCTGTNSTTLTLSGHTGSIVKWQSSTDNFSSVINDVVNTTTSLTASDLTVTTQYRAVIQSGVCATANSSVATVTVDAASVGGSISGSTTVCTGTNSTTLTLSGHTGSIVKWQSSTDNFSSVINDIINTTTSLNASNLTVTTQYRAVIQSGVCTTANSSVATVTVNAASVGGSIGGGTTVCTGTNSTTLTLSGNTGSIVKWQSSTDNFAAVITDITNSTTSLTATDLTSTTQYRAVVQNETCASAFSSAATVTVNPVSVGGSVSGNATVCSGTNSTTLILSGHTGTVTKWQSSTDNFVSVINDIANTTTSLTANNVTAATQYRAVVQSGVCTSANSATATITVNSLSIGGSVAGGTSVCTGTNSTTLTLSGNTGTVTKWQFSTDNFASVITDVTNTTTSLTANNLTATTQYRAVVQNGVCSAINSSPATITVNAATLGGVVSGGGPVCEPPNSKTLMLSGNNGSVLKWQSSTDNFVTDSTDIANTTNMLALTDVAVVKQYRAIVQSGTCAAAYSTIDTLTIVAAGGWLGGSSGDYSLAANWCGGIPPATANVTIPANTIVYINSADVTLNSLHISSTASVVMQGNYNLNIAAGGSLTNDGSFNASGSTGTVSFLGSGTVSGTTTFQNISTNGALNFGTASTVAGNFTLQTGGSVTGNAPLYTCPSSTLIYNTGGEFARSMEWLPVASGKGYPSNVTLQNNTVVNFPVQGAGYICNDLTIAAGSSLFQDYSAGSAPLSVGRNVTINGTLSLGALAGGDISLSGNWTRNTGGIFINNKRKVTFTGAGNSVITGPELAGRDINGAFGGETFFALDIDKTSAADSVSLGSNITILNEVKYTAGIFDLMNSDVTITSNDTATAHIAPLPTVSGTVTGVAIRYGGIAGTGSGKFVIQRHLSIGSESTARRWRLLTVPLATTGAPTINAAWQEGVSNANRNAPVDPWPGFGTTITKSNVYNASDGYDQGSTNNASLVYYKEESWAVLPSTNTPITGNEGYMLFARGNRGIVVSTPSINANSTTLEPKGRINTGDITKTMGTGFQTIGNPYASAIDFDKIKFNNYSSGGNTYDTTPGSPGGEGITYYMWDPKSTGTNGVGKFITCSSNGDGTYNVTSNTGGIPTDGTIPSGAAFMMTADNGGSIVAENSGGSLTFHETDKLSTDTNYIKRSAKPPVVRSTFTSSLYAGTGSGAKLADGVINVFGDYNNAVDGKDAKSFPGFGTGEALSIARNGSLLSVERRNYILLNDTIFLAIRNLSAAAYQLRFKPLQFEPTLVAMLQDKFTGTATPVSIADTSNFSFNVTTDPKSSAIDRFRIVFKPLALLPVSFSNVKAYQQNDNIVVEWAVDNRFNISKYEVEKSTRGIYFTLVNITGAAANHQAVTSYNWLDKNTEAGNNFYRLKYHYNNGTFAYSPIVKVAFAKGRSFITAYPNPVTDGSILLEFNNIPAGRYHVHVINDLGKLVSKNLIVHAGGNTTQMLRQESLISGSYQIQIIGDDKQTRTIKIIVQTK